MDDVQAMGAALETAAAARVVSSPNPWVGCAIVADGTLVSTGATEAAGGRHAEVVALDAAGATAARGTTLVTTLEPCAHRGRTGPCSERIVAAGISRVVVGILDPDPLVAGRGIAALREAGVDVLVGVCADEVEQQLRPYLHHRTTGRPYVVCKLASTLDGAIAAADGTSRWITGELARRDAHRLRAESDAVLVGAGTVRADDPQLTVRHVDGRDPRRVVLGRAPAGARIHPCLEWDGALDELVDRLGAEGVVQLLVEGGGRVAASFHEANLVDRYTVYLAPVLIGGRPSIPAFDGAAAATMDDAWRGHLDAVVRLGDDVRLDVTPVRPRSTTETKETH